MALELADEEEDPPGALFECEIPGRFASGTTAPPVAVALLLLLLLLEEEEELDDDDEPPAGGGGAPLFQETKFDDLLS